MSKTKSAKRAQFRMRPLRPDDMPVFTSWMEQVEDLAMFDSKMPLPLNPQAVEATWRENLLAREPRTSYWFVIVDEEDRLAGAAGLDEINYVHGNCILPVFIAQEARRQGLALRAMAMLLDLAFDQLRLERVTTYYRADNAASRSLCRNGGFREEGVMRSGCFSGGVFIDIHVVGILAREWGEQRERVNATLENTVVLTLGRHDSGRWSWPRLKTEAEPRGELHQLRLP